MTTGHVVHVVRSDAFAGVERYVVDTACELHRRGWRVTVIGGDAVRMRAELPPAVSHHEAVTTIGVARALWRVGRCDVVHAHMTAAELPAAVLKRRSRARLVVTRHFATPRGRSRTARIAGRFIERRMDTQIAISQFVAESTTSPCIVIHNGVRSSDDSYERQLVVLVMQRLEEEKDTATALRGWAASGLADEGWRLLIHGRGREETELRALSATLGIDQSAEFAGYTNDPRAAIARAAIVLATARAEPFGLAVVESMAEATPVVASDSGAHRETLAADGVYFAPGDVEGCAAALRSLASDVDRRVELGHNLRARQVAEFSLVVHVDRLVSAYASATARANR